ncbi:pilus assembly protein [Massilia sp. TW-1]|uniref:Pilus assembly protein n=1 Tax=Telluria antibiotica TaxID=2717319 RepID=A0ABX0PDA7_9BURK|nr:DUF192 domain-containing protein [Telluria antibiotica]NIA54504.1 pilus assembly protein [Telluria antibiotica]
MTDRTILLHTASGAHPLEIALADGFWSRLRGLMLVPPLAPNAGLLLTRCASVHCAFMRQAIDVVYLDADGVVLACVPRLRPWRASAHRGARHTLELAAGAIDRLGIRTGDRLAHPGLARRNAPRLRAHAQSGIAMVEFIVAGPMLTLIGLGILQYAMIFFAKNQVNHATFMAARAGTMDHANLATIKAEYLKALVPMYGGGTSPDEIAASLAKATNDINANNVARIRMLNPTAESFEDWKEPKLAVKYNTGGKRVIPNANLSSKDQQIKPNSGQTIYDANLLKLRILHGYLPKIPVASTVFVAYLKAMDPGNDPEYTALVQAGRIPLTINVTMHMQSDAIEQTPESAPGAGNNGTPTNPGDPPVSQNPPPTCTGIGCMPHDPVDPGTPCTGNDCPVCSGG